MKNIFRISGAIFLIPSFIIINSCKKEKPVLPSVTTTAVAEISYTTAISGGNVTNDGGAPIVSRGVCWNTSVGPTIENSKTIEGSGSGSYTSNITQLTSNTLYHLRAYATNSAGTAYGNQETFTTYSTGQAVTVSDVEGNIYYITTIGTQTWMKENLKTTKYNNGTAIPLVTVGFRWYSLTTPGYCWYNNDTANKATYGALYNWFTVKSGRLCPSGWHVPSDAEWTSLTMYLGGDSVAVCRLKEIGLIHWQSPNSGANNESGFTALPGGCRDYDGSFYDIGNYGYWWSSTEFITGGAWSRYMGYDGSGGYRYGRFEQDGFSVRCIKDL